MNNKNNKGFTTGFWILEGVLFFTGLWWLAVPILLIKLFAPDTSKKDRHQAPSLGKEWNTSTFSASQSTSTSARYRSGEAYRATGQTAPKTAQTGKTYVYEKPTDASGSSVQKQSKAKDAVRSFTKTPSGSKGSIVALIIIGIVLAIAGLSMTSEPLYWLFNGAFSSSDFAQLLQGIGTLAGGACCLGASAKLSSARKRYEKYMKIIGSTPAVDISSLSKKTGESPKRVRKDLEKMVEKGYFGESAYVNQELDYLFRSTAADDELRRFRSEALKKQKQIEKEQMAGTYENILKQIRDVNDRIAHPEMTRKIYRLEEVTRQIFEAVEKDESKKPMTARFMNYYLPTTLKLLESYAGLEKASAGGENIETGKKSIEGAMDSIVAGFENQLDELYSADAVDISSDVDVMKTMLERDNPSSAFKSYTTKPLTEEQKRSFDAAAARSKAQREAEAQAALDAEEASLAANAAKEAMDTRSQFEKDFGIKSPSSGFGAAAAQATQEKQE